MKQVNSSLSGVLWDEVQKSPFYEYKVSVSVRHHVVEKTFINYSSLIVKFSGLDSSICVFCFFCSMAGFPYLEFLV